MRFWARVVLALSVVPLGGLASAQGSDPAANAARQPIAWVPTSGVTVAGGLEVADGKAAIANNGTVTAGNETAHITLARGGDLALCASTTVHLTRDSSLGKPDAGALMISLNRGALEAHYATGQYSDVLMTPELRILVSGPGDADLKVRVSANGDTCVDNRGQKAPYVTVSSQFEDGLYRVQPDQRVSFEHGNLHDVVDKEPEPCGCPAPVVSVAATGTSSPHRAHPGQPVGGPSSTPKDTEFPLAQSMGLAPAPPAPTTPAVPTGEAHAQVTVPLVYDASHPPAPPPPAEPAPASPAASPTPSTPSDNAPPAAQPSAATNAPLDTASLPPGPQPKPAGGIFHKVGRFFKHIFGG